MKRWYPLTIILLVLALVVTACTQPAANTTEPAGEENPTGETGEAEQAPVVVLQGVDPVTLDPAFFASTPQWSVFVHLFDTLTQVDLETGEIVPDLATSWEQIDDMTWRFHLRDDVTFQNGEPFDAEVVKYNLDRLVDPDVGAYTWFFVDDADYKESKVVDDYTIDIITKQPSAVVANMLSMTFIVPRDYYSSTSPDTLAIEPVGSGPYKLVDWKKDQEIRLERWDGYWGDKPDIQTIVFRPVPEAASRVAELVTGNADVVANVSPDQTPIVDSSDAASVKGVQGGRDIFIMIDNSYEPFGDVNVRKAVNYAVNKQAILDSLFNGNGKILAGVANSVWENTDLEPYSYNPDKALELFAEAGYTPDENGVLRNADGESIKAALSTPFGRYLKDAEVAQAVGADLRRIGMEVEVQTQEWSVRTERQRAGTLEPLSLGGLGGFFNCVGEMRWVTPSPQYSDRDREIRWQSPEFESLYDTMKGTLDNTQRKQYCDQLQQMAYDGVPWIFLYKQYDLYGVSDRMSNWSPRADEVIDLRAVTLK